MKVTTKATHATICRTTTIEDGPVLPSQNSSTGKVFQLDFIKIVYTWKNGQWIVDGSYQVTLGGYILKKDGSASRNHTAEAPPYTPYHNGTLTWLTEIIDILQPKADLSMITLNGHEVPE